MKLWLTKQARTVAESLPASERRDIDLACLHCVTDACETENKEKAIRNKASRISNCVREAVKRKYWRKIKRAA